MIAHRVVVDGGVHFQSLDLEGLVVVLGEVDVATLRELAIVEETLHDFGDRLVGELNADEAASSSARASVAYALRSVPCLWSYLRMKTFMMGFQGW